MKTRPLGGKADVHQLRALTRGPFCPVVFTSTRLVFRSVPEMTGDPKEGKLRCCRCLPSRRDGWLCLAPGFYEGPVTAQA